MPAKLGKQMTTEHRSGLTQLLEHHWATDPWPVAGLSVLLAEIAARNGLVVQSWVEDGLGPHTGCGGRLPSGVVILLEQSAHLVSRLGAKGPHIYADATDVHRLGTEQLLAEVLSALGLRSSDVQWRNRAPTDEEIASYRAMAERLRRERT